MNCQAFWEAAARVTGIGDRAAMESAFPGLAQVFEGTKLEH
jgi:hypothetical protein